MIKLERPAVLFALLCSIALPLAAQTEIDLHGSVETLHALPFSKDRGLTDSRTAFTGEVNVYAGGAAAFVSLSAEYNGVSPDRTGFSLGEAWADWGAGGFSLRLGRQLVSWGVAEGLVLSDVVCPQNLISYVGLDFAGSRLAVDGVRLRYSFPALAVEALWLPLFTPARLPGDAKNPLHGIFYPPSVDVGGTVLPVSIGEAALPQVLADGEYGLRVSCYTSALDFSFTGFYGWNDVPHMNKKRILPADPSTPTGIELTPGYARTVTAGADAGIPLGELLLRLETTWTGGGRYDRPAGETAAILMSGESDEPVEKNNLKALAGIDWNTAGWTLSAQYYEDLLPDARGGGTERPWRKNGLSLRIAKGLFRETLNISAWCYLDLADFDSAGSVSADYALTDALSFSLGSDFFTGGIDNRGSYGAYKDLSCLWFKGVFRF
ncbi:MAG: hypothetical protein LBQ38_01100 [Spirochaetaceae bacterium]|jgi:hypothetical protein|nr:hypothetical protein [Spirochaetaceae bacterium]